MNQKEPHGVPIQEVPRPPSHLNRYGKRKWKELAPVLAESRIMTENDLVALEVLCESYGQYREAQYAVYHYVDRYGKTHKRTLGEYLRDRNSQTMPEYTAMNKALSTMRGLLAEFGMSPASRSRVSAVAENTPEDPMDELLRGTN
jgi:P27 family predicted phage terminase small subunit